MQLILEEAPHKLTRQQLLAHWPTEFPQPSDVSLWRLLKEAAAAGRVCCEGSGRSNEPFRYWLPGREEAWRALYGPDWEALSDEVKVTLYFRAQFLKDEPVGRGAAGAFLPTPVLDLSAEGEADAPPGAGD